MIPIAADTALIASPPNAVPRASSFQAESDAPWHPNAIELAAPMLSRRQGLALVLDAKLRRISSPPHVTSAQRVVIAGNPDQALISTSLVERQNLTMRMNGKSGAPIYAPPNVGGLGMQHLLLSAPLPDGNEVCIAPVSADAFEANSVYSLGDDTGYFIYEYNKNQPETGIEILAKVASYDAAIRIVDIFLSVQQQGGAGSWQSQSQLDVRSTNSSSDHSRSLTPASIAGVTRKVRCTRTKSFGPPN